VNQLIENPTDIYAIDPEITSRLDAYTNRTETCWLWTASLDTSGYGLLNRTVAGKHTTLRAHRYSYLLHVGPIPPGKVIDHTCHVRSCVNPGHMRPATRKQNAENREGAQANNLSSGVRGVYWHAQSKKWRAMIRHDQKLVSLGLFTDKTDAAAAVSSARKSTFTFSDMDNDPNIQ
jgi:hypothetical protein